VDITAEGFQRAYAVGVPATPEYEIQAQFEFTFLRRNAHWGYPCIVASGLNATTLHYETNRDTMKAGDLLLMDDAAEFDGYSVDVTRTIPVSGKYSKEQAEIYRLVWAGQQAGIEAALPGKTNADITAAADKVMAEGLVKLGLMTDVNSKQQLRVWFNHGISHGIGLNVHDPGRHEFQPGMAITVEPGIYIRPDALDNLPKTAENEKFIAAVKAGFEKYKGIGVRIEDDVLITNGQPQVLSAGNSIEAGGCGSQHRPTAESPEDDSAAMKSILCFTLFAASVYAQSIVIRTGTILDGRGGVLKNRQIVIEGSKIRTVAAEPQRRPTIFAVSR
jgi:Xaa-Pro aminopeptidase